MTKVRVLWGSGSSPGDALCTLCEINGANVLLDCGYSPEVANIMVERLRGLADEGVVLDAVLITHADAQHIGALPVLFAILGSVPVICTLPVLKMGQLVLYDLYLNRGMEGKDEAQLTEKGGFSLDDIDGALGNAITVRYNQSIPIPRQSGNSGDGDNEGGSEEATRMTTARALPSGRTIGGTIWSIKYSAGDIMYAADLSLSTSAIVDGVRIERLPVSPSVLIMPGAVDDTQRKTAKSFPIDNFIDEIMTTLRGGGNVLVPCESAGRTLDLMRILGTHWAKEKYSVYHLVYCGHMSHNVMEFARSQLEWMSQDVLKEFLAGHGNPFELHMLKTATSIEDVKAMTGPKVVLCTDPSLEFGLAKELLLQWGGDSASKVIFTDALRSGNTLATEIRAQLGRKSHVVVTVRHPERVRLRGAEMEAFNQRVSDKRRRMQEQAQMLRRENELAQLVAGGDGGSSDDEDEDESGVNGGNGGERGGADDTDKAGDNHVGALDEDKAADAMDVDGSGSSPRAAPSSSSSPRKKARFQPGRIHRFAKVTFPLFESSKRIEAEDIADYGMGITDLFPDDTPAKAGGESGASSLMQKASDIATVTMAAEEAEEEPFKIVSRRVRVQFKCAFVELCDGRAPRDSLQTFLSRVQPQRVVFLRLSDAQRASEPLVRHTRSMQLVDERVCTPGDREGVTFPLLVESVHLKVPSVFFSMELESVRNLRQGTTCHVAAVGDFSRVDKSTLGKDGIYSVSLTSNQLEDERRQERASEQQRQHGDMDVEDDADERQNEEDARAGEGEGEGEEEEEEEEEEEVDAFLSLGAALMGSTAPGAPTGLKVGAVSMGEVTLDALVGRLREQDVVVEEGVENLKRFLLCGPPGSTTRVRISQDSSTSYKNSFNVDGQPSPTLLKVRDALYQLYAFI